MTHETEVLTDSDRMACYQAFATAFSYPGPSLFQRWPEWAKDEHGLITEYDRLFRASGLWLYGAEHLVENEFQRARILSDIMGFYQAFGIEPNKERPDALACELEFVHYLIHKRMRLDDGTVPDPTGDKLSVCREAERGFFAEHLAPAVAQIAPKVKAQTQHPFYRQAAEDLLVFIDTEHDLLDAGQMRSLEDDAGCRSSGKPCERGNSS